MKKKFFLTFFLFLFSFFLFASSLEKGFEALKVYNYFEAKNQFTKAMKTHHAGASYGLSIIYYRNDNPFYNIDSAYKYILLSEKKIKSSNTREKETLQKLSINQPAINEQKEKIIKRAFEKAKTENTVASFNWFITNFLHPSLQKETTALRNKLAFDNAKKINSVQSYKDFIATYSDAEQISDAKWLYDFTLFNSMTKSNNLETYEAFVKQFPNSPYLSQAEDSIFSFFTCNETVQEYRGFIKKYSNNHNVKKAWDIIYFLSTIDFTYSAIANFIFDFPDFPDKQRADADLQRSKMNLFPVIQDGKWGFMDSLGNIQIQCAYDWADNFSGGTAVVILNDKSGYINKAGNIIIPLSYNEANTFHYGLAVVKKENKFGLISKTGQLILPFEFDDISGNENADNIIIALKEGIYKY
ncbi:MAG: WG repeat-containing protein, partial [Bacteroidota bacterium]